MNRASGHRFICLLLYIRKDGRSELLYMYEYNDQLPGSIPPDRPLSLDSPATRPQSFVTIYNIIAREPILNYLKLWTTKLSSSSRSRSISRYRRYTATAKNREKAPRFPLEANQKSSTPSGSRTAAPIRVVETAAMAEKLANEKAPKYRQ